MSNTLIEYRKRLNGIWQTETKVPIRDSYSLSLAYTPGVGKSCLEIHENTDKALELTNKANSIAVITDSPSNIPTIELKSALYSQITGIDAYPLVIETSDINKNARIIENLSSCFYGFDIEALSPEKSKLLEEILSKTTKSPILYSHKKITKNDINSCLIFKAIIDTQSLSIPDELYQINLSEIKNNYSQVIFEYAKILTYKNNNQTNISPKTIKENYENFLIEGKKVCSNLNYLSKEHSIDENSIELHKNARGMMQTSSKIRILDEKFYEKLIKEDNTTIEEINKNPDKTFELTAKGNTVAVITDGSAVLGFGNIGTEAALPVMEGKSALFKTLAGVDAFSLCFKTQDTDELIDYISSISGTLGGINLEDISAPRCFEIEQKLIEKLDIPVFHDDQHGTAVVALAGFINAVKLTGKDIKDIKVVVNGAGAGAISVSKLLLKQGVKNLILCDTKGAIYKGRTEGMNSYKEAISRQTNPYNEKGELPSVIKGADFFIGLSKGNILTPEMIKSMANKPVIFALANPIPEIMPEEAKKAGAFIVATGRSDFKNQVNNSLAFPGIFRGALDIKAKKINDEMKIAAANAIAGLILDKELNTDYIIPNALDLRVPPVVAASVAKAAIDTNVARLKSLDVNIIEERTKKYLYEGNLLSI